MANQLASKTNKAIYQDRLIRALAKKYNKDERVIREIVYSPLKFTNRVISDPLDMRPIRIRYFGVFALKHKNAKDNLFKDRVNRLKDKMSKTLIIMASMGYLIKNESSVNRILDEALEIKDYEKVQLIWEEYKRIGKKI
jgi:nucleoid DNA-binding protein